MSNAPGVPLISMYSHGASAEPGGFTFNSVNNSESFSSMSTTSFGIKVVSG